jgi:hypothetical protein
MTVVEKHSLSDDEAQLRDFVAATLGERTTVTDHSRPFGRRSITWRVQVRDGTGYFVKRHEHRSHYHAEHVALTQWAPKLERSAAWSAPEVVANSPELGAVIITELPGEILQESKASLGDRIEMHRIAGWLARQIHDLDVDPGETGPVRLSGPELFASYIEMASPYVDPETLKWVEHITARDDLFDGLAVVPTHSDFSPRNWIFARTGDRVTLGLIDWERARPSYWLQDIYRVSIDHWLKDPELRDAFFEGYGREPSDEEETQRKLICLANAVGSIPWAIEHDDVQFANFARQALVRLKSELS